MKTIRRIWDTKFAGIWHYLLNLGVRDNMPENDISFTRLFNLGSFVTLVVTIPVAIDALRLGIAHLIIIKCLSLLIYLALPFSTFIRNLTVRKAILYVVLVCNVFVSASTFGAAAGHQFIFIPVLFASTLIFDAQKKIEVQINYLTPALAIAVLFITDFSLFRPENLTPELQQSMLTKNLLVVLISVHAIAYLYSYINGKQRAAIKASAGEYARLNRKLQRTTELLSGITENVDEIFWVYENGQYIYVSPAYERVFEMPVQELLDNPRATFRLIDPRDRDRIVAATKSQEHIEMGYFDEQYRIRTDAGNFKWIHARTFPVFQDGKLVRKVGIAEDITRSKQQENDLIKAREDALAAVKAKSEFLSTMSHELHTPMNAVVGISYLLLQNNPRPDQVEYLKTLQFSADNLLTIINDVLDFSKIEAGKIVFESLDFSLKELLSSLYQASLIRSQEKDIELKLQVDADLPDMVIGDPVRISQILNNLISNAIKFTAQGWVCLAAEKVEEDCESVLVRMSVADTGIGISPDKQSAIFQAFTQANSDTTRRFGGTGLGLTITRKLLEMQNSEIIVESEPGKGSRFYFTLRLKKSDIQPPLADNVAANQPTSGFHGAKILLVEDNRINRLIAERFLKKWEMQVDYAENGKQALALVQENQYDLILMDLQMPVMDGYQATRAIRELGPEVTGQIPIIALTAEALTHIREQVIDIGMNDFITKPFKPDDLYATISRHLSK